MPENEPISKEYRTLNVNESTTLIEHTYGDIVQEVIAPNKDSPKTWDKDLDRSGILLAEQNVIGFGKQDLPN